LYTGRPEQAAARAAAQGEEHDVLGRSPRRVGNRRGPRAAHRCSSPRARSERRPADAAREVQQGRRMLNRLDRAIAYVAPGLAARRAEARIRLMAAELARAYYDGADTGRRGNSIRRSGADANVVSQRSLPKLRAGARDLV